jgi:Transglycosylase-like domain
MGVRWEWTVKPRLLLGVAATLAALAGGAFAVAQAGAADSGGVGPPLGSDGDDSSSDDATGGGGGGGARDDDAHERVTPKFQRLWNRVGRRDRRWARQTAECESGRDPDAIGGGGLYRGAFQFMRSTWKQSPHSPGGDPIEYPYRTQAVVAVGLKKRDGAGHWPVCG